jgi:predicted Zn-dependent protease with MMP-like domain
MDTPEMFEQAIAHIMPEFEIFWGESILRLNEISQQMILENICVTNTADSIKSNFSRKEVERIVLQFVESPMTHYVVTTEKQGDYEIKIPTIPPSRDQNR